MDNSPSPSLELYWGGLILLALLIVGSAYYAHTIVNPLQLGVLSLFATSVYLVFVHRPAKDAPPFPFETFSLMLSTAVTVGYWFIYTRYVPDPDQAEWFTPKEIFGVVLFWWPALAMCWCSWILENILWKRPYLTILKRLGVGVSAAVLGVGIYPFLYGQFADLDPFRRIQREITERHLAPSSYLERTRWENHGIDPVTPGTVSITLYFAGRTRDHPHRATERIRRLLESCRRVLHRRDTARVQIRAYVEGALFYEGEVTDENIQRALRDPIRTRRERMPDNGRLTQHRFLDLIAMVAGDESFPRGTRESSPFAIDVQQNQLVVGYRYDTVRPEDGELLWSFFENASDILVSTVVHYPAIETVELDLPSLRVSVRRSELRSAVFRPEEVEALVARHRVPPGVTSGRLPVLLLDDDRPDASVDVSVDRFQRTGALGDHQAVHYLSVHRQSRSVHPQSLFERHYLDTGWLFVTATDHTGRVRVMFYDDDHPDRRLDPRWLEPGERMRHNGFLIAHLGMREWSPGRRY